MVLSSLHTYSGVLCFEASVPSCTPTQLATEGTQRARQLSSWRVRGVRYICAVGSFCGIPCVQDAFRTELDVEVLFFEKPHLAVVSVVNFFAVVAVLRCSCSCSCCRFVSKLLATANLGRQREAHIGPDSWSQICRRTATAVNVDKS